MRRKSKNKRKLLIIFNKILPDDISNVDSAQTSGMVSCLFLFFFLFFFFFFFFGGGGVLLRSYWHIGKNYETKTIREHGPFLPWFPHPLHWTDFKAMYSFGKWWKFL